MAACARSFAYYASIMLNAFKCPLCPKLCWHNRRKPTRCGWIFLFGVSNPVSVGYTIYGHNNIVTCIVVLAIVMCDIETIQYQYN